MRHERQIDVTTNARATNDAGFSPVQVLSAIGVLVVLIAVTIPIVLNNRQGGADERIRTDLASAAAAQQSYVTSVSGRAVGTTNIPELLKNGASFTTGNVISIALAERGYCVRGSNPDSNAGGPGEGGYFFYDSEAGGTQRENADKPAPGGACGNVAETAWVVIADGKGGEFKAASEAAAPPPPAAVEPAPAPVAPAPGVVAPAAPGGTTGTPPANDLCLGALTLTQPDADEGTSSTLNVSNRYATPDPAGAASVYWKSQNVDLVALQVQVAEPRDSEKLDGVRTLTVYEGPSISSDLSCNGNLIEVGQQTGQSPSVDFTPENCGCAYYYAVSGDEGIFRLSVTRRN